MGILSQGLKISPAEADFTGSMFGDGIYFADTFDKSVQYCSDWNFFIQNEVNKFVLVCEVALGKMSERKDNTKPIKKLPGGCDSVKGMGTNGPDERHLTSLPSGTQVPLGEVITYPVKPLSSLEQKKLKT